MVSRRGFLEGAALLAPLVWNPRWRTLLPRRSGAPRRIVHLHSGEPTDGLAGARFAAAELRHTAALLGLEVEAVEHVVKGERETRDAIAESRAAGALGLISTLTSGAHVFPESDTRMPAIDALGPGLPGRACPAVPFSTGIPFAEAARGALHVLGGGDRDEDWVLVISGYPGAQPVASYVARLLKRSDARLSRVVPPNDAGLRAIASDPPDGVLLALDPHDSATDELIDQLTNSASLERTTLVALSALTLPDDRSGETLCVLAWHPTLLRFGAAQLNERYRRAVGRGMSSEAWSAWIAVKVLGEAVLRSRDSVGERLANSASRFDGHKGAPLSFRQPDRWLRQPLYVARQRPGAAIRADLIEVDYADGAPISCVTEGEGSA